MITVQVCYALPDAQTLIDLKLPAGTALQDAILASRIPTMYPQINLDQQRVGVFGCIRSLDSTLKNGDRVEIYRPLIVDSKSESSPQVQKQRTKDLL
ncbi:RnfH family protein [Candidatus Vallotiella sp. (ex Adelges kitamiensis)]